MRFDRRFLTVLAASLGWALVVAFGFYRLAGPALAGRARAESTKPMVVAAKPLPIGSVVDKDAVKLRHVPQSLFPAGAFSQLEDVLQRPVVSPIQLDEPVVEARIAAKGSGIGLAPLIPTGMRAIAVRVNDVVGVAGFILPGMRVDVLVTGRPPNRADTVTRTVLQNIGVLSAGQTTQTDGKSQSINTPVVTLLVDPQEAEALTLANNEGHIQLVLRNSNDATKAPARGRGLLELYGQAPAPAPAATAEAAVTPRVRRVRAAAPPWNAPPLAPPVRAPEPEQMVLIRGSVKKVEVFGRDEGTK
jgi:pilus assembly protein CpaB